MNYPETDQVQYLNEISFVLYEGLKPDFDKQRIYKYGLLQSISDQNRLVAFFKYLQANIHEANEVQFKTCCRLLHNFSSFDDQYTDLRFLIFFLNKCRASSGSAEQNLKQEFGKIIVRYMQVKLQFG